MPKGKGENMSDQTEWEKPKCKGCGQEIDFIQLRNFKGEIKAHPVEVDKNYVIMATGEKTEKGQYVYESRRILTSHFKSCPKAEEFRNKNKAPESNVPDEDKPPF